MTTLNYIDNPGRLWTNMPQSNALVSDIFIFITGGFHLAVSVGWSFIAYDLHFRICWFIGVAIGCILAPLFINWKSRRAFIHSSVLWDDELSLNPYCLQGIFCIIFGVIALLLTFTSIDSPIFHLCRGDEPEALNCIVRLSRPTIMSNGKQATFNKLKEYVAVNESMSSWTSFVQSLSPLLRVLLYRSMLSFIVALPITEALVWTEVISNVGTIVNWPPILYGFIGILGVLVGITTTDAIGRKAVSLFSLLCVAGMTIGVGIIFHDPMWFNNSTKMAIACALMMIAQIFGGIFAPSTTIYLGEAFPLQWKQYFIAFAVLVQYMVDLIIVCAFTFSSLNEYVFYISAGVIMFGGVLIFSLTMPETRKTTLQEAQETFSHGLHLELH